MDNNNEGYDGGEGEKNNSSSSSVKNNNSSIAQRRKLFKMKPSLSVDVNCTKILPYLFLGGYEVTTDKRMMQDTLKITHIVNVTVESECHFEEDFKYAHIKLSDSTDRNKANLLNILDEAFA